MRDERVLGQAMSEELAVEIAEAIRRDAPMEEFVAILRSYRDRGVTAESAYGTLDRMRVGVDDRTEDRILDVMDVVSGFCAPSFSVWNHAKP